MEQNIFLKANRTPTSSLHHIQSHVDQTWTKMCNCAQRPLHVGTPICMCMYVCWWVNIGWWWVHYEGSQRCLENSSQAEQNKMGGGNHLASINMCASIVPCITYPVTTMINPCRASILENISKRITTKIGIGTSTLALVHMPKSMLACLFKFVYMGVYMDHKYKKKNQ